MIKVETTKMTMPVFIVLVDERAIQENVDEILSYFDLINNIFNSFDEFSYISKINRGEIKEKDWHPLVKEIITLAEKTKKETDGYFEYLRDGKYELLGIVKGFAIHQACNLLKEKGLKNFLVEIAGDIEVAGLNEKGEKWKIGIRNPFNKDEIIKVLSVTNAGIATSGNYERGEHIYNPHTGKMATDISSLTVIAKNALEADRFSTPFFAEGKSSIYKLEQMEDFEGYMVYNNKEAVSTTGLSKFIN